MYDFRILLFSCMVSALCYYCDAQPTVRELKCEVCRAVIKESITAINSADPKKVVQIGSFRLQGDGTQKQKAVQYAGSEIHMHDVLEEVCSTMDNYAQATHKETGELALINLSKEVEKLSSYTLLPDPDSNTKLKKYCEDMLGEYEDDFIRTFSKNKIRVEPQAFKMLCENNEDICQVSSAKSEL
ncbi:protein canopy homolog 2-like [Ornithodoros turicata]|uniref:protein canopy homolog 2-like n=1 Tax=Ornithodoros turicata TaxID=34597 RepID=UPI003138778C